MSDDEEQITVQYTEEQDQLVDDEESDENGNEQLADEDDEPVEEPVDDPLDDDYDNQPTFQFTISDPSKSYKGKSLSFWLYKVTTRTSRAMSDNFQNRAMVVRRRFSQFLWLRSVLVEDNPGCIVPPLPEKSILGAVEKFVSSVDTKGLLEYRQRSLTKFLTRVGEHNVLQNSPHLHAFVEKKFNDFDAYKKEQDKLRKKKSSSNTWFKKSLTKEPKWITQQKKFVSKLEESLKNLKGRLQDLVKKRKEMSGAIGDFGKAFNHLGLVEKAYEDGSLSTSLIELSNKSEQLGVCVLTQAERETMQVIETITYYLGMCDAMKRLMKRLESLRLNRDDITNTLKSQNAALTKVQKTNNEQKIKVAEEKVSTTEEKLREADASLQESESCFKNDIERFDMERKVDFAYMLHAFVALQIDFSVSMRTNWESLLPSIQALQE